ncbi:hypothetical protein LJC18_00485 [Lachnospiraceae bacterium OttesenSCG-928-E19]|nr:hypothetical protein [Lachnospiraceae bacterium OttesenSCG-928-E19]
MDREKVSHQDEISFFLEQLDFRKKTLGGCDKRDVLEKISELNSLYEKQMNEKEEVIRQLEQRIEDLLEEQKVQQEKMRLVEDMEVRQKLERNEILIRAEHEAKVIVERAEQGAATIRAEAQQKYATEIKEKRELLERLNHELNAQLCDMRAVLKITAEEFSSMQSTILGLEERFNAYPPMMFVTEKENEGETYYVEEKDK